MIVDENSSVSGFAASHGVSHTRIWANELVVNKIIAIAKSKNLFIPVCIYFRLAKLAKQKFKCNHKNGFYWTSCISVFSLAYTKKAGICPLLVLFIILVEYVSYAKSNTPTEILI